MGEEWANFKGFGRFGYGLTHVGENRGELRIVYRWVSHKTADVSGSLHAY
jgi:hypothetical protein